MTSAVRALLGALALLASVLPASADKIGLLKKAPTTPVEAKVQAGLTALDNKKYDEAAAAFKEGLKLDPKAVSPLLGLAQTAFASGDRKAGENYLQQAAQRAPNSAELQTLWGNYLYFQKKDFSAAEAALRTASAADPKGVASRLRLGDLYLVALQRPKQAAEMYQQAIGIDSQLAGAHYGLGLALAAQDDVKGAERELQEAEKLQPTNPLPSHVLGRIYLAERQYPEALAAFDRALKSKPDFAAAHMERGNVLFATGKDEDALSEFRQALAANPKLVEAEIYSGMIHQKQGRYAEAERAYRAAVAIQPKASVAYNNLAVMAVDRKTNLEEAVQWGAKAVAEQPNVPEFYGTLGWAYRAQGNLGKAEETLAKGASLKPTRAVVVYRLGVVHQEQGKKAAAIADLKRALTLDPKFPDAADAQSRLAALQR